MNDDSLASGTASDDQRREDRRRKRKALIAGGVVLGLGAAATLATWSDDIFAKGNFQTGKFDLLGSQAAASSTYSDYSDYNTEASAADLTTGSTDGGVDFRIDSLNMSPGETVVAPFSVATTNDTTVNGRYWLQNATVTGPLAPYLAFAIVQSATCTADDPSTQADEQTPVTSPWKTGTFASTGQTIAFGTVPSSAAAGHDIAVTKNFGSQSHLCVAVTLEDDEAGIKNANATGSAGKTGILWHFSGEAKPLTD